MDIHVHVHIDGLARLTVLLEEYLFAKVNDPAEMATITARIQAKTAELQAVLTAVQT